MAASCDRMSALSEEQVSATKSFSNTEPEHFKNETWKTKEVVFKWDADVVAVLQASSRRDCRLRGENTRKLRGLQTQDQSRRSECLGLQTHRRREAIALNSRFIIVCTCLGGFGAAIFYMLLFFKNLRRFIFLTLNYFGIGMRSLVLN